MHREGVNYTTSESDEEKDQKLSKKKSSNKILENNEYSSNDGTKPAIKTLKKTFTSMLSRIPFSRNHTDTSSISEFDSDESEMVRNEAGTLDRSNYRRKQAKKQSGKHERARSETSLNQTHSGALKHNCSFIISIILQEIPSRKPSCISLLKLGKDS